MSVVALDGFELEQLFKMGNLIHRQLQMDSLEHGDPQPFQLVAKDLIDGDFSAGEKVNINALNHILKWVRNNLNITENELRLVNTRGYYTIEADANVKKRMFEFLNNHIANSTYINTTSDLTKEAFYTKDTNDKSNLSPKGLTLIQNYYSIKDKLRNDTFICEDVVDGDINQEFGLKQVFDKLAQAKDGVTFNIVYRAGGAHWVPLQCQKRDGKFFIIEMDSLGTKKDFGLAPKKLILANAVLQSALKDHDVTILRAENQRQMAPNNCGYFSLKDARKMQNNPNLLETIMQHQTHTNNDVSLNSKVKLVYYLTPVEHMATIQSRSAVTGYVKQHNALIQDKQITDQTVLDMSFNKVKEPIKSRVELTGKDKQSKVVLMVKDKYMSSIVDVKINKLPLKSLEKIVDTYNANKLTVERMNQTVDEPRNLAKITPDPEEIIVVEAKTQPQIKADKAKEEVVEMPKPISVESILPKNNKENVAVVNPEEAEIKKMPSMKKTISSLVKSASKRGKAVLISVQNNAQNNMQDKALSEKDITNAQTLIILREAINNVVLDNTVGQITKSALVKLKDTEKSTSKDPAQSLKQLKEVAERIVPSNMKSAELKEVLDQIKQAQVMETTKRYKRT